jgi:hypothetical protein
MSQWWGWSSRVGKENYLSSEKQSWDKDRSGQLAFEELAERDSWFGETDHFVSENCSSSYVILYQTTMGSIVGVL